MNYENMLRVAILHEHLPVSGCLHSLGFARRAADAARKRGECHHDVFGYYGTILVATQPQVASLHRQMGAESYFGGVLGFFLVFSCVLYSLCVFICLSPFGAELAGQRSRIQSRAVDSRPGSLYVDNDALVIELVFTTCLIRAFFLLLFLVAMT